MRRLLLQALLASVIATACFGGATSASNSRPPTTSPPHPGSVQRAIADLKRARFGPYLAMIRPTLHDIRCIPLSSTRVRCHATYDDRQTKPILFGVKPTGQLYVIDAGPLAIP